MTIDNFKEQIETTASTIEKPFDLGELRILAALFFLLLAPSVSRPTAISRLRFGDIRVVLARDPEGGPHNLLVRFTPNFTKTYLGMMDAKTFTLPETLGHPCLLFNPHILPMGVIFHHRVFLVITSPHQLDTLDIRPGERELPLPLRKDMKDVYVFRRAIKTLVGFEISPTELLLRLDFRMVKVDRSVPKFGPQIRVVSEPLWHRFRIILSSFLQPQFTKCL